MPIVEELRMDAPGPVICGLFLQGALLLSFCNGCRMSTALLMIQEGP